MEDLTGKYLKAAKLEIESLHIFFEDWFGGLIQRNDDVFEERFSKKFTPDSLLIQPGGHALLYQSFREAIRSGYGGNPAFRIDIRNVALRYYDKTSGLLIATYEEWQKNAVNSTPSNNGRVSTVIFKIADGAPMTLKWFHIHETWLPNATIEADGFDF